MTARSEYNQLYRYREYRKCVLTFFQTEVTVGLMQRDYPFFSIALLPLYDSALRIDKGLAADPADKKLCDVGISLIDTIIEISIARKKEIEHER